MENEECLKVAMKTLRQIAGMKRNTKEKMVALGAVRFLETQAPELCREWEGPFDSVEEMLRALKGPAPQHDQPEPTGSA